jgi:hypothetical protein
VPRRATWVRPASDWWRDPLQEPVGVACCCPCCALRHRSRCCFLLCGQTVVLQPLRGLGGARHVAPLTISSCAATSLCACVRVCAWISCSLSVVNV